MSQRADRLTVATYNIHACVGADRACKPERIAGVLREIDADIIGLQEVETRFGRLGELNHLDHLARETGLTAVFAPAIRDARGGYGNALLTRFPVTDTRWIDLAWPGREPRIALDADLDADGTTIRVLVTHLGLSAPERRFQIDRLATALDRGPDAELTIILGDMNVWEPRAPALRPLDHRLGRAPAVRSYPILAPVFALDRIWVDPADRIVEIEAHRSRRALRASDHLPVRAVLGRGGRKP